MDAVNRMNPLAAPARILLHFESAAISAFRTAFPNATVTGCYFYLTPSAIRKLNEIGMKVDYESD